MGGYTKKKISKKFLFLFYSKKQNVGSNRKKICIQKIEMMSQCFTISSRNPPQNKYKIWWISWANCEALRRHFNFLNAYFLPIWAYILIFELKNEKKISISYTPPYEFTQSFKFVWGGTWNFFFFEKIFFLFYSKNQNVGSNR